MSYPVFASGDVLNASDMNAVGLWRVTGCTVTSAGGTAATASNGVITIGTGNTSVTVSNAFSADYDTYIIQIQGGTCSANTNLKMQLGATTTGYYGSIVYANYVTAAIAAAADNNTASFSYVGVATTSKSQGMIELASPFLSDETSIYVKTADVLTNGNAGTYNGFLNNTTSYTAFTISPAAGSLTGGIIRVYGYRK